MESLLQNMLDAAAESGSPNTLSLSQVRSWLSEYLAAHDEDVRRFSGLAKKAHGDILIADFDDTLAALFVAALFTPENVVLATGRGNSSELREFADQDFPTDMSKLIAVAKERFTVIGDTLQLTERDIREWVGAA